jgi:hypothetical protein
MSAISRFRPSPAMVVALIALVIAISGVAFASIPGSNGVYKACYNDTGAVRVIDSAASCTASETQFGIVGAHGLDLLRPYGAFRVDSTGQVQTIASAGITRVSRVATGKFCIQTRVPFPTTVAPVSAAYDPNGVALAYMRLGAPDCPAHEAEVVTGRLENGRFVPHNEGIGPVPDG